MMHARFAALGMGWALGLLSLSAQTLERVTIDFNHVSEKARELASRPYQAPDAGVVPQWMKGLDYDQYRDIRFLPDKALWSSGGLGFRLHLFHPGYLFKQPVMINECTATHSQRIRFTPEFFDYGPAAKGLLGELPAEAGYAGFRLHAPLNRPELYDELIVFQGASYWRALGKGQRYGISARGLALDTGVEAPEEFPLFREFWVRKPDPGSGSVDWFALLDSPSVAGAYWFTATPGEETEVLVRALVHVRKEVRRFGIAPMSSMYWFGENSRRRFDDLRPEVHDSDGLAIRMGSGERIWRPLSNDSGKLEFSFFGMDGVAGFGLVQRDRRFAAFEDGEAHYQDRPGLWIEPLNNWRNGRVMLMEIPAENEVGDNVVALWEPAELPKPGSSLAFAYRQKWTKSPDPAAAGGYVVATRTGVHKWEPERRTVVVEFAGGRLAELDERKPPQAVVSMVPVSGELAVKVDHQAVQRMEDGRWRVSLRLAPAADGGKLADSTEVEMRCTLKTGDDYLTETWAYRIKP
jgi:glucans biosynthesis protein